MDVTTRVHLEQQGYQLDDGTYAEVGRWLRLAPLTCSAAALAGTLAGSPVAFFFMAPLGVVGALTGRHPLEWVADRTARRRPSSVVPIPLAGPPRRFAYAVAAAWLVVTGIAFAMGITVLGAALGLAFTLATGMAAPPSCALPASTGTSAGRSARPGGVAPGIAPAGAGHSPLRPVPLPTSARRPDLPPPSLGPTGGSMRRFAMAALAVAVLPASAAAQNPAWPFPASPDAQRISAQGMGEVNAPAARATALFVIRSEGGDVAAVARENAALQEVAIAALQRLGMDESSYTLVSYGAGPAAGSVRPRAPGQPVPPGMQEAKAGLRVVIEPVDRLDEVVTTVLGAGAESVANVTFEPWDGPESRRQAARIAMERARVDAEAMADAAGMRLGRLLQVVSTPDYLRQSMAGAVIRATMGQGVALTPSDVTVRVTLQAFWELLPR